MTQRRRGRTPRSSALVGTVASSALLLVLAGCGSQVAGVATGPTATLSTASTDTRTTDSSESTRTTETSETTETAETTETSETTGITDTSETTETSSTGTTTITGPASKELRIGVPDLAEGTDPIEAYTGTGSIAFRQVFDTLTTTPKGAQEAQPGLATAWTPSADRTSWTLTLADGVKFSDGEIFDADAVCKNFAYWKTKSADHVDYSYYFDSSRVTGCTATSDAEVELTFGGAVAALPDILSLVSFSIQAPKTLGSDTPAGTGAYVFEGGNSGQTVRLKAVASGSGPRTIEIRDLGYSAGQSALDSGQIDGYLGRGTPLDGETVQGTSSGMIYLNVVGKTGALADASVRKGVMAAIDINRLRTTAGATKATGIAPSVLGLGKAPATPSYNPVVAKKALAGKNLGTVIIGIRPDSQYYSSAAVKIVSNLADVGITARISKAASISDYYSSQKQGRYQISLDRYVAYSLDPVDYVSIYATAAPNLLPSAQASQVLAAYQKAERSTSASGRRTLAAATASGVISAAVQVPVGEYQDFFTHSDDVSGAVLDSFSSMDLSTVTVR